MVKDTDNVMDYQAENDTFLIVKVTLTGITRKGLPLRWESL